MERNYLAHRQGDAANAGLAPAGYNNFWRRLAWLRHFLAPVLGSEADFAAKKSCESWTSAWDPQLQLGSVPKASWKQSACAISGS